MSHTLKLCTVKQLKTDYGIPYCRQHIWRLIRAGQFPAPRQLGQARIAFHVADIEKWITTRPTASPLQGELPL